MTYRRPVRNGNLLFSSYNFLISSHILSLTMVLGFWNCYLPSCSILIKRTSAGFMDRPNQGRPLPLSISVKLKDHPWSAGTSWEALFLCAICIILCHHRGRRWGLGSRDFFLGRRDIYSAAIFIVSRSGSGRRISHSLLDFWPDTRACFCPSSSHHCKSSRHQAGSSLLK